MVIEEYLKGQISDSLYPILKRIEAKLVALEEGQVWFSIEDAARRLDVSVGTVRKAYDEGRLRGYKKGPRCLRFWKGDLDGLDFSDGVGYICV